MEEDKKPSSDNSSSSSSDVANHRNGDNVNTGRWTDSEHRRFLDGLAQYGTGNWKKITEKVGTRSCTQVRTHAQKYFIALQKPPHVAAKSSLTVTSSRNGSSNGGGKKGNGGSGRDIDGYRKKSRLLGEHLKRGAGGADGGGDHNNGNLTYQSALYGGHLPRAIIRKQRGLTGIEVLAQAAETENDYDSLEQTVVRYNQQHRRSRKRKNNGAVSDDVSDNDDSSSEDDDDGVGIFADTEEEDDDDDDEAEDEERNESPQRKPGAVLSAISSRAFSRSTPPTSMMANGPTSERVAALAMIESSTGGRATHPAAAASSTDELEKLRQEVLAANQTIMMLRKQAHDAELRAEAAIDDKSRAMVEIKTLQEINAHLKTEHRRALVMLEHSTGPASRSHLVQHLESRMGMGGNSSAIMAAAAAHGLSPAAAAAMAQQHQQASSLQQQMQQNHAHVFDLLQNQLTEAELRFHQVTESLTRQTGVLTDQHRAILELNSKLEKEKAKRRAAEAELSRLKGGG